MTRLNRAVRHGRPIVPRQKPVLLKSVALAALGRSCVVAHEVGVVPCHAKWEQPQPRLTVALVHGHAAALRGGRAFISITCGSDLD